MPPVAFVKTVTWPGNFRNIFHLPKNGQNGVKKSQIGPSAPLVILEVSICIEIKAISVHTRGLVAQFSTVTAKSGLVALPNFFDGVTENRPYRELPYYPEHFTQTNSSRSTLGSPDPTLSWVERTEW
ncbi:hypothetical protein DFH08DRAFT_800083 [Mycena albidolilacea]|uniref:Uncharacterized protein n=1 Tax=Mycena albidolilacea TaxID=1033008 RepID=A0AAD7F3M3_9AGAR|nr:hypothetical protein DFH08DRAFT_800083 [Mycena albidolilacea]